MLKRYVERYILEDLRDKMVFISGPRQVGKTTLARQIGEGFFKGRYDYLNWDNREDRKNILRGISKSDKELFIFDEIHKYRGWKNYLKGEHDKHKEKFRILVTGSARLDIYKKGGDSLLGRYHPYRLHPLSLGELHSFNSDFKPFQKLAFAESGDRPEELFNRLLKFGGFPEIYVENNERTLRRWHNERIDKLVKEDIRDIENVRDLSALQVLVELLPDKVGSLFSINSLKEDLGVTHKTLSLWVAVLEKFYYHYRIYPYQSTRIKSLRKEPKLYLWDWSEVRDEAARFENMAASHLLKFSHFLTDVEGYKAQLYYLRDKDQRETDFLITIDNKPWFCVEVKSSFKHIESPIKYFVNKLNIPFAYCVVRDEDTDFIKDDIRVINAGKFLSALV